MPSATKSLPDGALLAQCDGIRPITDREFNLFRKLVDREAGIHLSDSKRALLVGRLTRRLRELGLTSFSAYYRRVTEEDPAELTHMLDRVSTNETHFFREPRQFEFLRETVVPQWVLAASTGRRTKHLRVWSAACSTGEEPYSLAMTLLDCLLAHPGWELEILASDISTRVLRRAEDAVWPIDKAKEIPAPLLRRYMLRGTRSREGQMKAGPLLRSAVRFARNNLNSARFAVTGPFDLIFCRNVLIYFDTETKRRVVQRLLDLLAPDGYLFLGHAESLMGLSDRVQSVGPTVYVLARQAPLAAAAHSAAVGRDAAGRPVAAAATRAARRS
jgi:chemotaxis protein methyltransferase CheR